MCKESYKVKFNDRISYFKKRTPIFECVYHRTDGPADIAPNLKAWWINGKLHREDGPAIMINDSALYYLNSIEYSENRYWAIIKEYRKDKLKDL